MSELVEKVNRRFLDNIWPTFSRQRKAIKEAGVEKLCSSLYEDYFTIIRKCVKNDLSLAEKSMICPPIGLKFLVKTKITKEILSHQAYIFANYDTFTAEEFLNAADVIIAICIIDDKKENEVLSFSWLDFKNAEELGSIKYSRTKFGFDMPEISEYLSQLLFIMSELK